MRTGLQVINCHQRAALETSRAASIGNRSRKAGAIGNRLAFSLVEIMIVMGLLSIMVIGLMAMFNQTQRAFRLGMAQTDVLESGRTASELLGRELQQITPTFSNTNFPFSPAFYAKQINLLNTSIQNLNAAGAVQTRTNMMEDIFFVTRENQTWKGIGYFVRTNADPVNFGYGCLGTLYRFETNKTVSQFQLNPGGLVDGFANAVVGNLRYPVSKIVDGVVHFRLRAYDTNGLWITPGMYAPSSLLLPANIDAQQLWPNRPGLPGETTFYLFRSNAVPASLELEIGILEPQIVERMRSFPTIAAQSNFLAGQAAHVHLFRQRISIRNVDPSGYQ